jgi:hypothetical protein
MRITSTWTTFATVATIVASGAPALAQSYAPGTAYTPSVIDSKGTHVTGPGGKISDVWSSGGAATTNPAGSTAGSGTSASAGATAAGTSNPAPGTAGSSAGTSTGGAPVGSGVSAPPTGSGSSGPAQ